MTRMHIRGVSLFVHVIGQGDPLLLMHGGPGLNHTSLLPLQPLADQCTLIFYDHLPPEHQAILADRIPNAQLEIIERAGHNPYMERPAAVIQIIKRFLAQPIQATPAEALRPEFERATFCCCVYPTLLVA